MRKLETYQGNMKSIRTSANSHSAMDGVFVFDNIICDESHEPMGYTSHSNHSTSINKNGEN